MAPESKQGLRTWLWTRKGSITTKRSWFRGAKRDRKSTRLNSSHLVISYAVFCLKKKNQHQRVHPCLLRKGGQERVDGRERGCDQARAVAAEAPSRPQRRPDAGHGNLDRQPLVLR